MYIILYYNFSFFKNLLIFLWRAEIEKGFFKNQTDWKMYRFVETCEALRISSVWCNIINSYDWSFKFSCSYLVSNFLKHRLKGTNLIQWTLQNADDKMLWMCNFAVFAFNNSPRCIWTNKYD